MTDVPQSEVKYKKWKGPRGLESATRQENRENCTTFIFRSVKFKFNNPSCPYSSKTWSHGSLRVHSAQRPLLLRRWDQPRSIHAPDWQNWNVEFRTMQRQSVEKWGMQFCFWHLLRNDPIFRLRDPMFSKSVPLAKKFPSQCRKCHQSGSTVVWLRARIHPDLRRLVRGILRPLQMGKRLSWCRSVLLNLTTNWRYGTWSANLLRTKLELRHGIGQMQNFRISDQNRAWFLRTILSESKIDKRPKRWNKWYVHQTWRSSE